MPGCWPTLTAGSSGPQRVCSNPSLGGGPGVAATTPGLDTEALLHARPSGTRHAPSQVDELVANMTRSLEEVREVTEQLEPERARSCRNAITMALVMVDEIR
jgi:hypothetical protein